MSKTVRYETPNGIVTVEPTDTHTDVNGVLTCLWKGNDEVAEKMVQIPLSRVIEITRQRGESR